MNKNKWKKHYDRLIERAINRILEEYTEKHHIVPKCMGGVDEGFNLVNLTPREHFVAHQLLVKIYPENKKLSFALKIMSGNKKITNRYYGWIKNKVIANSNILSKEQREELINRRNSGESFRSLTEWVILHLGIQVRQGTIVNIYKREVSKAGYNGIINMPSPIERNRSHNELKIETSEKQNKLTIEQRKELITRRNNGDTYAAIHKWLMSIGVSIAESSLPKIYNRETKLLNIDPLYKPRGHLRKTKKDILCNEIKLLRKQNISYKQIAIILSEKLNETIPWKLCYSLDHPVY